MKWYIPKREREQIYRSARNTMFVAALSMIGLFGTMIGLHMAGVPNVGTIPVFHHGWIPCALVLLGAIARMIWIEECEPGKAFYAFPPYIMYRPREIKFPQPKLVRQPQAARVRFLLAWATSKLVP